MRQNEHRMRKRNCLMFPGSHRFADESVCSRHRVPAQFALPREVEQIDIVVSICSRTFRGHTCICYRTRCSGTKPPCDRRYRNTAFCLLPNFHEHTSYLSQLLFHYRGFFNTQIFLSWSFPAVHCDMLLSPLTTVVIGSGLKKKNVRFRLHPK